MDYNTEQEFRKVWGSIKCKINCSALCSSVNTCLGISAEGSASLFLNEQGDWVAAGGGGTPSAPLNSIQYNNAGSFFGDALATRNAATGETYIQAEDDYSVKGLQLLPQANSAYLGVGDVLGGDPLIGFAVISTPTREQVLIGHQDLPNDTISTIVCANDSVDGVFTKIQLKNPTISTEFTFYADAIEWGLEGSDRYFVIDISAGVAAGIFEFGGINGGSNGTKLSIDDASQLITLTNVPTYADDAAAGVGGLTTGQLYKTTTLGSTFLKIVP